MSVVAVITPTWDTAVWVDAMRKAVPHLEVRGWPELGDIAQIDYAACWLPPAGLLSTLPNLKLMIALGAGVDGILNDPTLPSNIPLLRVVDRDLTSRMSEYIVMHVLMHSREHKRMARNQHDKVWDCFASPTAKEFCVGILGQGALGQDAAHKLLMMGYNVRGWSRRAKTVTGVSCYSGQAELGTFLSGTDILVSLLPATPDTKGIINRNLLSQLSRRGPFGAGIFINVGRGATQNEADILSCLDDGTLNAATLDVFGHEPLPNDSPFWHHPRVTLTPHSAANSDPVEICTYVSQSIAAFEAGQPFMHVVDKKQGY